MQACTDFLLVNGNDIKDPGPSAPGDTKQERVRRLAPSKVRP